MAERPSLSHSRDNGIPLRGIFYGKLTLIVFCQQPDTNVDCRARINLTRTFRSTPRSSSRCVKRIIGRVKSTSGGKGCCSIYSSDGLSNQFS